MARMAHALGHFGYSKTMTQMTQDLPAGQHGHAIKNHDPNDPNDPRSAGHAGASHADKMTWCNMAALATGHADPQHHGQKAKKIRGGGGRAERKGPAKTYGP